MRRPEEDSFADPQSLIGSITPEQKLRFSQLSAAWIDDTKIYSTPTMFDHPAYRKIIDMGPSVVPLVLQVIENRGSVRWFQVLEDITGHSLEREDDQWLDVRQASRGWLEWDKEKGLYPLDKLSRTSTD